MPLLVSWPGGNCDVAAQQALFTKTLTEGLRELGVRLDVQAKPMSTPEEVSRYLAKIKKRRPTAWSYALWNLACGPWSTTS